MSEFQPQESSEIQFCLGNHEFSFTPDDLPRAFTHDDPQYDHFLYVSVWRNGRPKLATIFFRELFERHGVDMDDLLEQLVENDVELVPQGEPGAIDLQLYKAFCDNGKEHPMLLQLTSDIHDAQPERPTELPYPEEKWGQTKKDQAEKWGGFVAYLAESIANGERAE